MKIIKQIFVILLFFVIGEVISYFLKLLIPSIYIPGTIIGMVLLVFCLTKGIVKFDYVNEVGTFLTSNMSFFFIPAAVSVIEYLDILKAEAGKILMVIIASTIITTFAVTYAVKLTYYLQKKKGEEHA